MGKLVAAQPLVPMMEGMWERTFVDRPSMKLVERFLDSGVTTPAHSHRADQAAYHISGTFELTLDGETVAVGPGDAYFIASGTVHSLKCLAKGSYVLSTVESGSQRDTHEHDDGHHT